MESFPIAVICYLECLRAQCWVLCRFCSTLMTCHRIFFLIVVCLPMMSYCIINIRENHKILQKDFNKLEECWKLWQLSLNHNKCSILSIHDNTLKHPYYLNNSRLRNVLNHSYLGIELSYDLKWEKHMTNITAKASRTLGMLSRVLKMADTRTRQLAYNTLVRPILEFGCQVWDQGPIFKKGC